MPSSSHVSSGIFCELESRNTWEIFSLSNTLKKNSIICFSLFTELPQTGVLFLLITKYGGEGRSCPSITSFSLNF